MSTSANVTYYEVYKDDKLVGKHSQHCMCKSTIKAELSKYTPSCDYEVRAIWPDENEAPYYTKRMRLSDYLDGKRFTWLPYE